MSQTVTRLERARRLGARIALVLFGAAVIGITLTWTVQIIQQVWFSGPAPQHGNGRRAAP